MSFASGRVSFRIYSFEGAPANAVKSLSEHTYEANHSPIGDEVEYYICGMDDASDKFDQFCAFGHDEFVLLGLRIDRNDVPGSVKKKLKSEAEDAYRKVNPSGFISKNQRKEAKDAVAKQVEEMVHSRQYNRSKHVPVLIDLQAKRILASTGDTTELMLMEILERALGITINKVNIQSLAEKGGVGIEYATPTVFCVNPGANNAPSYPWDGDQFGWIGSEFMTWLFLMDRDVVREVKDHSLRIEKTIELHCSYGIGGVVICKGDMPSRSIEATRAFRDGKVARKASFVADLDRHAYEFSLDDTFQVSALKMEDIHEADSPREVAESRIALACNAVDGLLNLVHVFFGKRFNEGEWNQIVAASRRLGDSNGSD